MDTPKQKQTQHAVLIDYSNGAPVKINVHSEFVLEEKPLKRWLLHWVGTEDQVDYGQVGQLGLFHEIVPLDSLQ
jgi:hypothetical protein